MRAKLASRQPDSRRALTVRNHRHVESLIDRRPPAGKWILDQVVFPALVPAMVPKPLGVVSSCALLRLKDGTVWMLRISASAWTASRLRSAANYLVEAGENGLGGGEREQALGSVLSVPRLSILRAALEPFEPRQWDVASAAWAITRRGDFTADLPADRRSAAPDAAAVERGLGEALMCAVQEFLQVLDPEVRALSTTDEGFHAEIYNYVIQPQCTLYRRQFAKAFPRILPLVIDRVEGSVGAEVREIVDLGRPLIKTLARRWGVRPGVVRLLLGQTSVLQAPAWRARVPGLAQVLNALIAEEVPRDDPDQWALLERVTTVGQRLFRQPIWETPYGLRWSRDAMHATCNRDRPEATERWLPNPVVLARIDQFRGFLEVALQRELGPREASARHARRISGVVDSFFASAAAHGLGSVASRFFDLRLQAFLSRQRPVLRTRGLFEGNLPPLLPADFHGSEGKRVIRPMTDPWAVMEHGRSLQICLENPVTAGGYALRCREGTLFLLGVFDATSGAACSTMSIAERRGGGLKVVEHKGIGNAVASDECREAALEFEEYLASGLVRRWLKHLRRKQRKAGPPRVPAVAAPNVRTLMRNTLGESVYEHLVQQLRESCDPDG